MQKSIIACVFMLSLTFGCKEKQDTKVEDQISVGNEKLISQLKTSAKEQLLDKWYPLVIDSTDGGYYSDVNYDFTLGENHNKMVVTQSRHMWTTATAAMTYPDEKEKFISYAHHGFEFLRDKMWDSINGGFHNFVTKTGEPIKQFGQEKTAYGNSFGIYGLATYYKASKDEAALDLAKKTFNWLEEHSHDSINKGYYQTLALDGTPLHRAAETPSTSDLGYKDQNSSIHLLEAFTALYEVWPDPLVKERLEELLVLIRDTITTEKGTLTLFLEPDWTPLSFRESDSTTIANHFYLDHVSFGHDVETAYLMLEATHTVGNTNDTLTLNKGKKMVDHSLKTGWDPEVGGFYDGGYYYAGKDEMTIVKDEKNWWSQAEGLNTLLIMAHYFPEDEMDYKAYFDKLWDYTQTYIMDAEHGGWYEWGIDKTPESKMAKKGHIWKGAYHNFRALTNCIKQLEGHVE